MGQYGAIIGGVVGAVVGSAVPGLGTSLGWAIGSALGGAYSQSQQVLPGPKIGDVAQQTAQEGGFRPIVYGRSHPIAGNIIADGGPVIVTRRERQGKGGPKVESESAYRTYAVGVCEGEATLLQAWRNGILVYDAEDSSMAAENAKFLEYATWYTGSFDQPASPDLEEIYGAGQAPFFRGTAYLSIHNEDVTDQRGAWSQWQFRVSTVTTTSAPGTAKFGASGAGQPTRAASVLSIDTAGNPVAIQSYSGGIWNWVSEGEHAVIRRYSDDFDDFDDSQYVNLGGRPGASNQGVFFSGIRPDGWMVGDNGWGYPYGLYYQGAFVAELKPSADSPSSWHYNESGYSPEYGGLVWFHGPHVYIGVRKVRDLDHNSIYRWPVASAGGGVLLPTAVLRGISTDTSGPRFWMHVSREGKVRTINTQGEQERYSDGLLHEGVEDVPEDIQPLSPGFNFHGFGVDERHDLSVYLFSRFDVNQHIVQVYRYSSGQLLYSGVIGTASSEYSTRVMFTDSRIYIQRRQNFYFIDLSTVDATLSLSDVVGDICDRAGLDQDKRDTVSLIPEQVRGYTIGNAYTASGSLQSLSSIFFFDPRTSDGRVGFVLRGGDAVDTILEDEMIDDDHPIEDGNSRRGDSINIPRVLHLNYHDLAGGLNTDKQRSERPEGTRSEGEQSLQTTVTLSADEAASVVARTHGLMVEQQKGELNFSLPDNWLRLTESDPVFVQTDNKMVRAIIIQVETDDGEQRYKAIRDRQSLYATEVQGIPAAPVTRPPSSIAGPTLLEFLDIPILRDVHDQLGFYLAVSGILPAWPGASVELSLDGGENYIEAGTTRTASIIGELVTALGDHPHPFPDTHNVCEVQIKTPNALLENTTLAGMMNRRNRALIGDEIVNFADADEVTPGTWQLSHWLRGRKGTDTEAHAIGERFVLLDTAMFIPAELAWLGRDLTFRAVTFGRPVDEATIVTVPFTGQSQVERRPAYLQARRDGADAVISWQGVGRLGGGAHVAMGAHFAGYRVTLTDGSTTQTHDTAENALTTSLSAFSGPVTVTVQQRNNFTGLGPDIEVTI